MSRTLPGSLVLCALVVGCGGVDVAPSGGGGDDAASSTGDSTADTSSVGGSGATTTTTSAVGTSTGAGAGGSTTTSQGPGGGGGDGGATGSGGGGGGATDPDEDPATCEEAEAARTNLGCDFWPTVTANLVWDIFDYAVVVTNSGATPADVTIERNGNAIDDAAATVLPGQAHTFYLPWVEELKGPDVDCNGSVVGGSTTARSSGGAYHVQSSVPVAVYQFSPVEYAPAGGPPGKDWSDCPGFTCGLECFSYSNDASLILPSTSLGSAYRVVGYPSWETANLGSFVSIVGTVDDTDVTVDLGPLGAVVGGDGIPSVAANGTTTFSLDAGDVVQLVATAPGDFSGTLVTSSRPVQVISGIACANVPSDAVACDHLEEPMLPVESLGKHYFLPRPTGVAAVPTGHVVRLVGQTNGTSLAYPGGTPPGAPSTINAGQVIDLGLVNVDFEVEASAPLAVATFLLSGSEGDVLDQGDPSQSTPLAVEQFRKKYQFVAPLDWNTSFIDVILPTSVGATLDGAPLVGTRSSLSSGFDVVRTALNASSNGAHVLEATAPVGLQVIGYGDYSSYQFPGGVKLAP